MHVVTRKLPFKVKVMAMYDGQFYLRPALKQELITMLERKVIVTDRDAVAFIDENGEWLSDVYA